MKPMRGLCIGAGYFSRYHLDAWRRIDGVEIAGVCDQSRERAESVARRLEIAPVLTDAVQAMDTLRPDFVDIITPPGSHHDLVQAALSRGIPVLCQKPLAPTYALAVKLADMASTYPARLMVHENFRFQPWYREIHRLMARGVVGRRLHTIAVRTRTGDGWGDDAYLDRQPYFRSMARLLLHETGIHFADTLRYLGGEIAEVYAITRRLNPVIAGEDAALVTFRFASGATATWDASRFNESAAVDPRYTFGQVTVEADGGAIRLYEDGQLTVQRLGERETPHDYPHSHVGFAGDCVHATQKHFIDRLRDGGPFETDAATHLRALEVIEAAYRSAGCNRPVRVTSSGVSTGAVERVVDLSLSIDDRMQGASVQPVRKLDSDGWNASTLSLNSHCGTHLDAPSHFVEGGTTVDELPLGLCRGPAIVIDLTPVGPGETLTVERVELWAARITKGSRVLLRTDWHKHFGTDLYRQATPRLSIELACWFAARGVALLGVEQPSVGDVRDLKNVTLIHRILFDSGVILVEGLANLDQLQTDEIEFFAFPLKVRNGDGTPVRAVAVERVTEQRRCGS